MHSKIVRRSAWAAGLALALAVAGLAGCGGGGSDGGGGGGGGGGGVGVSGTLWFYSANDGSLTAPANAGTASTFLTSDSDPRPWPDGSQYMEYTLTGTDEDELTVKETSSGRAVYQVLMPNFSGDLHPSPVSKSVVLTQYKETTNSTTGLFLVLDLGTQAILRSELDQPRRYLYRWLPDGRLVRFHDETGEIAIAASVSGAWQVHGRLSVPANRRLNDVRINPQGTRLALIYLDYDDFDDEDPSDKSDLWVANLDGSAQERVTLDERTYGVLWSPDGTKLAFDNDTSHCGGNQNCAGDWVWWWAPATARNLQSLAAGVAHPVATQFERRWPSGQVTKLVEVSLQAWLP